jgi:hypothetical protein
MIETPFADGLYSSLFSFFKSNLGTYITLHVHLCLVSVNSPLYVDVLQARYLITEFGTAKSVS